MLCRSPEPFDYAIYGIVLRTLSDWSLENRTGRKVPRIEANCSVIAAHRTIPSPCGLNFPEFNLSGLLEREWANCETCLFRASMRTV
jgi:hypothetical protein